MSNITSPKLSKTAPDKRMSMEEAISRFVHDGDQFLMSTHQGSFAGVFEICRQKKQHLHLITDSSSAYVLLMIGLGMVDKVTTSYLWGAIEGTDWIWRRAVEQGIPHPIEVELYSNFGMALAYQAGAMNVPFLPMRSQLGTDIMRYNPNIKEMEDPYGSGDKIALVPAITPDVCLIHAPRADKMGNVQMMGQTGNSPFEIKCAKRVIVSCEELVTTEEIMRQPNLTVVPHYYVDAVVEQPFASHFREVPYKYFHDFPFGMWYYKQIETVEGFQKFCDEYVFGTKNWDEYLKKVGYDRVCKLAHLEKKFQAYGEVR